MSDEKALEHDVYSQTHEDGFDWNKWNKFDREWWVQLKMDAKEVRLLYSMICFYLSNYSGAPGRPPDEENYLKFLKGELYKMIQDYNFTHNNSQ
tara:strand:+ start:826 stop:1107 length:282 start_codon:yes stop_codon:yes gene_type:complete